LKKVGSSAQWLKKIGPQKKVRQQKEKNKGIKDIGKGQKGLEKTIRRIKEQRKVAQYREMEKGMGIGSPNIRKNRGEGMGLEAQKKKANVGG